MGTNHREPTHRQIEVGIDDARKSFMFFYNFVHRYNITLDHHFDALQTNFNNMVTSDNYLVDERFTDYFDVFKKYYPIYTKNTHIFWYVCALYFIPIYTLQRFYTFLLIETWKVMPESSPVLYDDVRKMDKKAILAALQEFVDRGDMYLFILIQAILHFF
jgi:hypothetical protein